MPLLTLLQNQSTGAPAAEKAAVLTAESMGPSALPGNAVLFYDETGLNPLPPGVLVEIYLGSVSPQNLVTSGYLGLGGTLMFSAEGAVPYTAVFTGTQAPPTPMSFMGSALPGADTIVNVTGYRSPTLSADGYRDEVLKLLPRRRASQAGRSPGGIVYAMAKGLGAVLAALDENQQKIIAGERLPTCTADLIDSWAYDFFGPYLLRFLGEDDPTYYSRVLTGLGPRCTLAAIEQVVNQFYTATATLRSLAQDENVGYDTVGGYDRTGGFDVYAPPPSPTELIPAVKVWDTQSNPTLAGVYGIAPPYFVINIGFSGVPGWFLDHDHLDVEAFLIDGNAVQTSTTPPDTRLGALVNLVKQAGTIPLYQTYSSS